MLSFLCDSEVDRPSLIEHRERSESFAYLLTRPSREIEFGHIDLDSKLVAEDFNFDVFEEPELFSVPLSV